MYIIDIDKEMIPYSFEIELSGKNYEIEIDYNFLFDFFVLTLKLNGEILAIEKAVLNEIMFKEFYLDKEHNKDLRFPDELFVFASNDDNIIRITFDNLNESVFLYCNTPEEIRREING